MRFSDYIDKCRENKEFDQYWIEDELKDSGLSISEAPQLSNEIDVDELIENRGIKRMKE